MSVDDLHTAKHGQPRVVVVGPCASGKTTLVERLKELGIDARVSGQEHSAVRNLWRRLDPDILIALEIDLDTLRSRRSQSWPQSLFEVQLDRLREAVAAADAVIDSVVLSEHEVFGEALRAINLRLSS